MSKPRINKTTGKYERIVKDINTGDDVTITGDDLEDIETKTIEFILSNRDDETLTEYEKTIIDDCHRNMGQPTMDEFLARSR